MARNRESVTRKHRNTPAADRHDIFEERHNHRDLNRSMDRDMNQGVGEHTRHRRQLLVEIFDRDREERDETDLSCSEDEHFNEEDYCWYWDEKSKSNDVNVQNCGTEAYFHPDYSCGTAAIRGNRQFREGEEHYWEVQMSSAVYGTDMMIGIGASSVDLDRYKSQFCSIIGKDTDSWGISYFGTLHHNGKSKDYTKKFERGAIIGCHLDLWKGTLSFYKNGKPLGIAFDGLLGKKLFPMISSTAARTKMKLLCSHKTGFSLQYLCCKEISKHIPSSQTNALDSLPLPNGLKRYISWRMDWVLKLNNPRTTSRSAGVGPRRKRIRRY